MKKILVFILVGLLMGIEGNAQRENISTGNDSIFISFDNNLIQKTVLINERNFFGDSLPKSYTKTTTLFLFITKELLILQNKQNKYRDSLIAMKRPLGWHKTPYGIELINYSLDFETALKNFNHYNDGVNIVANEIKDSVFEKKLEDYKRDLRNNLRLPLGTFFADNDFFQNRSVFLYTGTEENYNAFKDILDDGRKIFLILPAQKEIFGYDNRIIEVKKLERPPRL